ncbi:hypothetical protein WICPIJ_000103 [Wickerhamomyces pijperi]|uniref:Uncharacterized protein n=1 Tax=Wickerhamomyces pijperi TaxID=599730 RepID=A0A9P8QHR3_WICPI|nr:hypothetical protein WICPIJ_000103 [Wickerhamomyces pijperi]
MESVKEKLTPPTISSSKERKNKPRPANLNLSSPTTATTTSTLSTSPETTDMGSFAMKCISPGLPPLSAKMKTTFLISKSIEAQQRQIIASRNSASEEKDTGKEQEMKDQKEAEAESEGDAGKPSRRTLSPRSTIVPQSATSTSTTTGLTATLDSMTIPSAKSTKGLRRSNVPSPLNLQLNANLMNQTKPRINSAPMYQSSQYPSGVFTPATSRRSQFKITKPTTASTSHQVQGRTPSHPRFSGQHQQHKVPLSANPYQTQYLTQQARHYSNMVPQTAVPRNTIAAMPYHPQSKQQFHQQQQMAARYQAHLAYQQSQWERFRAYTESNKAKANVNATATATAATAIGNGDTNKENNEKEDGNKRGNAVVADVFSSGMGTRFAPIVAQPLSAQKMFFDLEERDHEELRKKSTQSTVANRDEEQDVVMSGTKEEEDQEEEEGEDVESNAIEPNAKVGLGALPKSRVVKSEIRLGHDLFKFDFERRDDSDGDKERFLSHCLTVWEEFTPPAALNNESKSEAAATDDFFIIGGTGPAPGTAGSEPAPALGPKVDGVLKDSTPEPLATDDLIDPPSLKESVLGLLKVRGFILMTGGGGAFSASAFFFSSSGSASLLTHFPNASS